MAMAAGPDQRDHEHRAGVRRRACAPPTCCSATTRGARAGSPSTARARPSAALVSSREADLLAADAARRGGARPAALRARGRRGARAERHAGVRRRELERHRDRLDLRRPRHVQEVQGAGARGRACRSRAVDPRAFSARRAARRLAAGLPRARARRARDRGAAAADAAEGGAGRRRPPRDPAPVGAEAPPRARRSRRWRTSARTSSACATRSTTSSRAPGCRVLRTLGRVLRRANWDVTAVVCDDELIDVEPGDTTGAPLRDRVRPRHDDGRRDAARPRDRARPPRCARCSTASSRSAPT